MRPMPASRRSRPTLAFGALRALFAALLACTLADAGAVLPGDPVLGDAPIRLAPQDTAGWSIVPKAAKTRDAVVQLFNTVYTPGSAVPLLWTGSIMGCNPGTTNVDHQQAVIDRVNYYRALVDLPAVALLTGTPTTQNQAAALMYSANNALSHQPPMNWLCYSADGAAGAGQSNIALGGSGPTAVDLYMDDSGAGNNFVGHRRWVLYPPQTGMATGDTSGPPVGNPPANALYVFGPWPGRPATPNGIAWPPAGYVPYQNLPAKSNRWSLSYPSANFSAAAVSVMGPGGPVPVALEPQATGYGDNTIVFLPNGISYAKPSADTSYTVTVSGIGGGAPATIQYTVTIIDPAAAGPPSNNATVVEYYWAARDHYFISSAAAEIAALDAAPPGGWVRTGKTFKTLATAQPGTSPVCRFYLPAQFGDSHYYGRGVVECNATHAAFPGFIYESPAVMYMYLPTLGVCAAGTIPVYRVFDGRADANHRYTVERAVRDQMVAQGWTPEGDGPDFVVMCAPQ